MTVKRRFGNVRQLPSGRWQVCYHDLAGRRRYAPHTFVTKAEAGKWLTVAEADQLRGIPADPWSREPLHTYVTRWLDEHPRMGPRYKETCRRNLRLHLSALHQTPLCELDPPMLRRWRAETLAAGAGATSLAQTYRMLRAALNTAVEDGDLSRNPCVLRGAGNDHAPERPVASVAELNRLIEAITPRFRAAVILGGWCGLRRGEILALHREDLILDPETGSGWVSVSKNQVELAGGTVLLDAKPKTPAGYRTVAIPPHVIPALQAHLDQWAGDVRLFASADGGPVTGNTLHQAFQRARDREGLSHLRFHDLRHTGQTLAAEAGANLADLMRRLGHASTVAAKRYLHATDNRDNQIAAALSALNQQNAPSPTPPAPSASGRPHLTLVAKNPAISPAQAKGA